MSQPDPYTQEEIEPLGEEFDTLSPLFAQMLADMRELSKKKPDGIMNPKKIETVNRVLGRVLEILDREPDRGYLEMINKDDVPQYSDVAIMMGQVSAAMNSFRNKYYRQLTAYGYSDWYAVGYEEEYEEEEEECDETEGDIDDDL